jgi:hypothetical protein
VFSCCAQKNGPGPKCTDLVQFHKKCQKKIWTIFAKLDQVRISHLRRVCGILSTPFFWKSWSKTDPSGPGPKKGAGLKDHQPKSSQKASLNGKIITKNTKNEILYLIS